MYARHRLIDDVCALLVELVDDSVDGFLVARDRVCRDDYRIARLDVYGTVRVECHPRKGTHRLCLAARRQDDYLVVVVVVYGADVNERIGLHVDVAQRIGDLEYRYH